MLKEDISNQETLKKESLDFKLIYIYIKISGILERENRNKKIKNKNIIWLVKLNI